MAYLLVRRAVRGDEKPLGRLEGVSAARGGIYTENVVLRFPAIDGSRHSHLVLGNRADALALAAELVRGAAALDRMKVEHDPVVSKAAWPDQGKALRASLEAAVLDELRAVMEAKHG